MEDNDARVDNIEEKSIEVEGDEPTRIEEEKVEPEPMEEVKEVVSRKRKAPTKKDKERSFIDEISEVHNTHRARISELLDQLHEKNQKNGELYSQMSNLKDQYELHLQEQRRAARVSKVEQQVPPVPAPTQRQMMPPKIRPQRLPAQIKF